MVYFKKALTVEEKAPHVKTVSIQIDERGLMTMKEGKRDRVGGQMRVRYMRAVYKTGPPSSLSLSRQP